MCAADAQERLKPFVAGLSAEARRVIDEELAKLRSLEPASSEFNITRSYLARRLLLPRTAAIFRLVPPGRMGT